MVLPASTVCPVCGMDLRSSERDSGVRLEDGTTACPAAFGPYRVVGVIGRGGMGVVYLARHEVALDLVAIKTVRLRKRGLLRRIRREILALARIRHPGLVRIIETGQSEGLPWYAMELVRGATLDDLFRGDGARKPGGPETRADFILDGVGGSLSPSAAAVETCAMVGDGGPDDRNVESTANLQPADFETPATSAGDVGVSGGPPRSEPGKSTDRSPISARDRPAFLTLIARICRTLAYLHGQGVVHRDIKPQNVIIRPDGSPLLLDFGLASFFGAGGRECLEIGGPVEGTPEYMSPEQIRGEVVDARADLYAVGCLLYEGLTGRVPFSSETATGTLRAHVKRPPIPPRQLMADLPEELEALILRLLAKQAVDRPGYARDVEESLSRIGADPGDWAADCPVRDYLYRPEFVGRAEVLDRMERDIRESLKWPGRCIFLRGSSGVGKTRLVVELARKLDASGLAVVTGECLPIGIEVEGDGGPGVQATPLHPFRALLQIVADACLEQGPAEVERLLGGRARLLSECEPALTNLPDLPQGDLAPEAETTGEGHRSRLIEALGETLSEFARGSPVVVFLDDLQWADALTLHFLALFHIGAWDSPQVAIVAAYRKEEEDDAMRGYRPVFQDATFVELGPLDESCLGEIIGGMLGTKSVDERLVGHLTHRAGGNPFFVAESLRAAVAEGLLRRDVEGIWRPSDAHGNPADPESLDVAIPLPGSIHELVVRRLSRLPDEGQRLLELASVVGRDLDLELLEGVVLLEEAETMAALDTLLMAQVLEEGRDGRFRFAHDKLREVAYEQIPLDRRRDLHRRVARAIEGRYERRDDFSRLYPTLAHHWYRAIGDRSADPLATSRAIGYLEKSVSHAVNAGLPREAVDFGRAVARLLGFDLPEEPSEIALAMVDEIERVRRALGGRKPLDLLEMPDVDDRESDRLIGLLISIHPPAFMSDQITLFALMASKNLSLTLAHGNGTLAPVVYAMYAIVTRIILDEARLAHQFGRLAIELDRKRGGSLSAEVLFLNSCFLNHWVAPIAEGLADCDSGAEAGMKSGPTLYGCFSHATYLVMLAASGAPLSQVAQEAEDRLGRVDHCVLSARFHCILERQMARALAGQTISPTSLTDDAFDEARDLAFICRTTNANQAGYYHATRMRLHYYQGEYHHALEASDQAQRVWESCARQLVEIDLVFFRALSLLALAFDESNPRRLAQIQAARERLGTLERWRVDCEANFGHKAMIVAGEVARAEGREEEALRLYDEAARSAAAHGFLQHRALALELAARHRWGMQDRAGALVDRHAAIDGYRAWGASTIADRLTLI
ncbi:serine/threonine-protein kinase PknK [Tundrisphaera lichenicola]|uniref:serine/threonine-protein kinase n=1 Tax=Tundrisphaera lichenicola TaxID=2029860 RepID=UPI003EC1132B